MRRVEKKREGRKKRREGRKKEMKRREEEKRKRKKRGKEKEENEGGNLGSEGQFWEIISALEAIST